MPQEDYKAAELDHGEEVLLVILPTDDQAAEVMEPGEEAFDFPAAAVAVGQIVPGSAGAENPKDAVEHRACIAPQSPALPPGFHLQQRFELGPLGVGEVHEPVLALSTPTDNTKFDLL